MPVRGSSSRAECTIERSRRGRISALVVPGLFAIAHGLLTQGLIAQAPVITPAGDPSVRNDSIYALAADLKALPKDIAKLSYVVLLDDGVARFESDGSSTQTFRQVIQVLTPAAVQSWSERSLSFNPERQSLVINWMRVVKPSGEVISDKPGMSQESDMPAPMRDPVYATQKLRRYSLTGVAPGTLVDVSWTMTQKKSYLAGNFYLGWNVSMVAPVRRSRFIADFPASMTPRLLEEHLDFPKQVVIARGRRVYLWARKDVQPPRGEIFAPDSSVHPMSLRLASQLTWRDVGAWYNSLAQDRYILGSNVTTKVDSVVHLARTRTDTLRALHHWIAHDLRYVAIALGIGGYQPRFPDSTVATGFGDCKDKATLFVAAARHLGITAYPVLLNASGVRDRSLPAVEQLNHVIAAMPQSGTSGGYLFTDLTTDAVPPTPLPSYYRNKLLLVVKGDATEEIVLPVATAPTNSYDARIDAELSPDGKISGHYRTTSYGPAAYRFSMFARSASDSSHRAAITHSLATIFPRARGDSLVLPDTLTDPDDPKQVAIASVHFAGGDGAKAAGPLMLLSLPATFTVQPTRFTATIDRMEDPENAYAKDPRRLPIDGTMIFGPGKATAEMTVRIPEGWSAQLPKSVSAVGPFGDYTSEYAQNGRNVTVRRAVTGSRAIVSKEEYPALIAWMKVIAADKTDFIVLQRAQ